MATEAEVAAHLSMSDRTVRDLRSRGVFSTSGRGGYDLTACREAYIVRLREQAAGRGSARATSESLDLAHERARLAKEQADHRELLNAQLRGSLIPVHEMEAVVGALVDAARTRILAVPSRAASVLSASPSQQATLDTLTTLIHEALQDLAQGQIAEAVQARAEQTVERNLGRGDGALN